MAKQKKVNKLTTYLAPKYTGEEIIAEAKRRRDAWIVELETAEINRAKTIQKHLNMAASELVESIKKETTRVKALSAYPDDMIEIVRSMPDLLDFPFLAHPEADWPFILKRMYVYRDYFDDDEIRVLLYALIDEEITYIKAKIELSINRTFDNIYHKELRQHVDGSHKRYMDLYKEIKQQSKKKVKGSTGVFGGMEEENKPEKPEKPVEKKDIMKKREETKSNNAKTDEQDMEDLHKDVSKTG